MNKQSGLVTLNHHLLAAVDVETTGLIASYHDVVQVAVLPLDQDLEPLGPFFNRYIKPDHPERATKESMRVNGLSLDELANEKDRWEVADDFHEWIQTLNLPVGKKLIPLAQNSPFDIGFMKAWLGITAYDTYFARRGRDSMYFAASINDQAAWKCLPVPFATVSLAGLCNKFGIQMDNHHDALADCLATAKVYRELLSFEL